MNKDKRVTAIFEDRAKAINAINTLETMGYNRDNLTMLVAENSWNNDDLKIEQNTKAPEGTAIGAGVGATVGAIAAGLTTVGAVAMTGGVGLLATGPLVAALAGAGAGGATGGLVGGLIGLGFPEVEAKFVEDELGKGAVMIGIQTTSDRADDVEKTMKTIDAKKVTIH